MLRERFDWSQPSRKQRRGRAKVDLLKIRINEAVQVGHRSVRSLPGRVDDRRDLNSTACLPISYRPIQLDQAEVRRRLEPGHLSWRSFGPRQVGNHTGGNIRRPPAQRRPCGSSEPDLLQFLFRLVRGAESVGSNQLAQASARLVASWRGDVDPLEKVEIGGERLGPTLSRAAGNGEARADGGKRRRRDRLTHATQACRRGRIEINERQLVATEVAGLAEGELVWCVERRGNRRQPSDGKLDIDANPDVPGDTDDVLKDVVRTEVGRRERNVRGALPAPRCRIHRPLPTPHRHRSPVRFWTMPIISRARTPFNCRRQRGGPGSRGAAQRGGCEGRDCGCEE